MGLIKEKYKIESTGQEISPAYAMVGDIDIMGSNAYVIMNIHTTRENLEMYEPLEKINITCNIDRNLSVYEQIYIEAKKGLFKEWQDDIQE
ncbi:MAG: hypothetical protein ACI4VL_06785 [Bacilli bacterium]